jgi:putative flavoprotein involved in K+ transport
MRHIDTLVIGAGHAGLAMSRCLTDRGRDYVVLERGRLAERWRTERWGSMRLLTPNWMSRLPGWCYDGCDPDGYMTAGEVVGYLDRYARSFNAPVETETTVEGVERCGDRFLVATDQHDTWSADQVVVATGHCDRPHVPAVAARLSQSVHQTTPSAYRNPGRLPDGGVLVVGAAASGAQLADELARSGREVVLAVGHHTRLPRRYRGMDICWWLERLGVLDKTIDEMPDPKRARREPSLQLVGRPDKADLDLAALQDNGVRLSGRLTGVDGRTVHLGADLAVTTARADAGRRRLLAEIDAYIDSNGLTTEVLDREPVRPVHTGGDPVRLDLPSEGISTVVWATGFRRHYPWLRIAVLDEAGEIRQRRGVTPAPGLYVLGLRFQHRPNSSFIDGVRHDAEFIANHLAARDELPLGIHRPHGRSHDNALHIAVRRRSRGSPARRSRHGYGLGPGGQYVLAGAEPGAAGDAAARFAVGEHPIAGKKLVRKSLESMTLNLRATLLEGET